MMDRNHQEIVDYIREYREQQREWPYGKTIIRTFAHFGCPTTVRKLLAQLEQAGVVKLPGSGHYEGVRLLDYNDDRPNLARRILLLEDELRSAYRRSKDLEQQRDELQLALSAARTENRWLRRNVKRRAAANATRQA
jgi:hypothetical protein